MIADYTVENVLFNKNDDFKLMLKPLYLF